MPKHPQFNSMSLMPEGASASDGGGMPFQLPQLTSTNYTTWVIRVQAILEAEEIWEAIEPAVGTTVDTKMDKKAQAHLL